MPRVQPRWNARAATKRGVVLPSLVERLRPYAVEGLRNTALPTHFIHFSQIEKVGLKLKSAYNTPLGVYTYPLTHYTLGLLERGRLPFAADRQYLILLRAQPDANLLYSEPDGPAVEYQKLVQNALRISRGERRLVARAESGAYVKTLQLGRLWNVTRLLADAQPKAWTALWIRLGIDGVVDNAGARIIHENEPIQAVFFHKGAVEVVDIYRNTMAPESIKRREQAEIARVQRTVMTQLGRGEVVRDITLTEPLTVDGGMKGLTLPSIRIRNVTWAFAGPLTFQRVTAPGSEFVRLPGLEALDCNFRDSEFREIVNLRIVESYIAASVLTAMSYLSLEKVDARHCQVKLGMFSSASTSRPIAAFADTQVDHAQIHCVLPAAITFTHCTGEHILLRTGPRPIRGLHLQQSDLPHADFARLEAQEVLSNGGDLRNANFQHARIRSLVLTGTAKLRVDLRGASFAGAQIASGKISYAWIDDRTVLPDNVELHDVVPVPFDKDETPQAVRRRAFGGAWEGDI